MRGRDRFSRLEPLIKLVDRCLKMAPTSFVGLCFELVRHLPGTFGFGVRYVLLRRLIKRCGRVVAVYPGVYFLNPSQLEIGDYVSIHEMCYLECYGGMKIGSHVSIAHAVSIVTHEHDYSHTEAPIREAPLLKKPVVIENDVWIGAGVRVLAGVTIGPGAVIGAGSVVTKDVPERSVAVGVPARVIRTRPAPVIEEHLDGSV